MEPIFINRIQSNVNAVYEALALRPALLLFPMIRYSCFTSSMLIFYQKKNKLTEKAYFSLYNLFYEDNLAPLDRDKANELQIFLKNLRNNKHKDKNKIQAYHISIKLLNDIKNYVNLNVEWFLKMQNIDYATKFADDQILALHLSQEFQSTDIKQDVLIGVINELITLYGKFPVFFDIIESLMPNKKIINGKLEPYDKETGFISSTVAEFPLLLELTYEEMKITRNNLQEKYKDFNDGLEKIMEDVADIDFIPENYEQIITIFKNNINTDKLQNDINEEIYIQKSRNARSITDNIKFNIGFTSINNIVELYEKSGILEPFVASTLKNTLKRSVDLSKTYMFAFQNIYMEKIENTSSLV